MEDVFYDPLPLDDGETSSSSVPACSSSSDQDSSEDQYQRYKGYKYKYRPRTSTLLPLPSLDGGATVVDDKVSSLLDTKVGNPSNRSALAPITSGCLRRPRSSHSLLLEEVEEEEETTTAATTPKDMDMDPRTKTTTRATAHHHTTGRHYWWYRFLSSLEMPDKTEEERLERWYELQLVSSDFESAATTLAKTIVTEYFLSNDQERTILPDDKLGGYAGGRKYVIRGILFKVALAETSGGLYCNANGAPDDELASKAASNEYRSTMHFARCQRNIPAKHRILVQVRTHRYRTHSGGRVGCPQILTSR